MRKRTETRSEVQRHLGKVPKQDRVQAGETMRRSDGATAGTGRSGTAGTSIVGGAGVWQGCRFSSYTFADGKQKR